MANYRSLHVKLWSDPDIEQLPALAKLLFLYLITNAHRNESALYSLSRSKMSFETGIALDDLDAAIAALDARGKVHYDAEASTVWVVNAVKHQALNANCIKSIAHDLERCSSATLAKRFCEHYKGSAELAVVCKGFLKGSKTVSNGFANPPYRVQGTGDRVQGEGGVGGKTEAEQVYAEYPRKVGKPDALKAITKALKKKPFAELLKLTRDYARIRDGDLEFVPNPATWFNGERYDDDPSTWKPKASNPPNNGKHPSPSPNRLDVFNVDK